MAADPPTESTASRLARAVQTLPTTASAVIHALHANPNNNNPNNNNNNPNNNNPNNNSTPAPPDSTSGDLLQTLGTRLLELLLGVVPQIADQVVQAVRAKLNISDDVKDRLKASLQPLLIEELHQFLQTELAGQVNASATVLERKLKELQKCIDREDMDGLAQLKISGAYVHLGQLLGALISGGATLAGNPFNPFEFALDGRWQFEHRGAVRDPNHPGPTIGTHRAASPTTPATPPSASGNNNSAPATAPTTPSTPAQSSSSAPPPPMPGVQN